jgi:hypothetical protein
MTQTEETQEENEFPYSQHPHEYAGRNSERQSVGDPGHCEACCSVGHVVAHPDLGCGDVGCDSAHPGEDVEPYTGPADDDPRFDVDTVMAQAEADNAAGKPLLANRVREPDDLPEPMADDVAWPDVDDVEDLPIAAQYNRDLAALMKQADAATERIETLYRNGIREIRELVRGS